MLANQIRPTTLSAATVFRHTRFWPKRYRELPFLSIALLFSPNEQHGEALPDILVLLIFSPVPQTTSGIGHRVINKVFFFGLAKNTLDMRNNNFPLLRRSRCVQIFL